MPKRSLPARVPTSVQDPAQRALLERVIETLGEYAGTRGHPLDQAVTIRMLAEGGLIGLDGIQSVHRMGGVPVLDPGDQFTDLTPPDALTNLQAFSGLGSVFLSFDGWIQPRFQYAEVWRATTDNLATAVQIAITHVGLYVDYVGDGVTRYYWVRPVNHTNIAGAWNAIAGVAGTPSLDPAYVLDILEGQVTEAMLTLGLNTRIDLIDGPDSLANSAAWRVKQEADARVADVGVEEAARIAAVSAEESARIAAVLAEYNGRVAADGALNTLIVDETTARTTQDGVFVGKFNLLGAANLGNTAWQMSNTTVEVRDIPGTGWVAIGTRLSAMDTRAGASETLIADETTARSASDVATASKLNLMGATNGLNTAWQMNKDTVEVRDIPGTGWVSFGSRLSSMDTRAGASETLIANETSARSALDVATAFKFGLMGAVNGGNSAWQMNKDTVEVRNEPNTGWVSLGSRFTTLDSRVGDNEADIVTETSVRTAENLAFAQNFNLLGASTGGGSAWQISGATVQVAAAGGGWTGINTRFSGLDTQIGDNSADIVTEENARISGDNANASSISTLTTTVNGHTTSINTNISSIDGIQGKYSVKVDNNGHVSGFGLISTANNGAVVSSFIILADTFAIVKPGGVPGSPVVPFVVGTVNGVSTVGISGALVVDGTISSYSIATNAITANKILAGEISAGHLAVGGLDAYTINMTSTGHIKGGATDYLTGTGFFLGYSGGAYKFSIGNPAAKWLGWDGTTLKIAGEIVDTTAVDYTAGTTTVATAATERTSPATDETAWVLVKSFRLKRPGTVTVSVDARRTNNPSATAWPVMPAYRFKQNGAQIGSIIEVPGTGYTTVSTNVAVTSPFNGDLQLEYRDGLVTWDSGAEEANISCLVKNVLVKTNPYSEKVTLD